MTHLPRQEIRTLIQGKNPILTNTPPLGSQQFEKALQPDSYDLRIGVIVANGEKVAGDGKPDDYKLPPGEVATVITQEIITLPLDLAAEVGPPNRLLNDGLLVLAAPHVDPGYNGPLTARVINLLNQGFPLSINNYVLTIRFNHLSDKTEQGFQDNVNRDDKIAKAIKDSRVTFGKMFLKEEDLVLKREFTGGVVYSSLTIAAVLVTIGGFLGLSWGYFAKLGTDLASRPEITPFIVLLAASALTPFLFSLSWELGKATARRLVKWTNGK